MERYNRINGKAHEMLSLDYFSRNADKYCGCKINEITQTSPSLLLSENDFSRIDANADSDSGTLGIEFKWREYPLKVKYYYDGCYVDAAKLDNLAEGYGDNGKFIAFWPVAEAVFVWTTSGENMAKWGSTLSEEDLPKNNTTDEVEKELVYKLPFGDAQRFWFDSDGWKGLFAEYVQAVKAANGYAPYNAYHQ